MKKIKKHLEGITKIMDYNDKYFIVYNEKNMLSFVTKDTLEFVHENCWFNSYKNYDDYFILVENMSGLYTLLRKNNLAFLKKGTWYKSWFDFSDNLFRVYRNDGLCTLLQKDNLAFFKKDSWYKCWFDFSDNLFRVYRNDGLCTLIKKSDGNYLFKDKWFSEIINFNQDYYKIYDKSKNCSLISKKTGEIITGVRAKYTDIFFDSGNYFLMANELICPARIYNKTIKPLKNTLWANDYTRIEGDFYLAFDGVKYDVINLKTGKVVFNSLFKRNTISIRKHCENYWLLSFLDGKSTLINKPKDDDENVELSFPITIDGKPLFFYKHKPFNNSNIVLLQDTNYNYHLFKMPSSDKLPIEKLHSDITIESIFYSNDKIAIISDNTGMYNIIRKSDCKLLFNEWFKGVFLYKTYEKNQIIVLNQKINDKYIIISDCGEILLKNIPILNANQIIISKNDIFIYDNNSNLIKINYK